MNEYSTPMVYGDEKIKELTRKLADAESAIQDYFANQVDSIIDPVKGGLILLRQAQETLLEEARCLRLADILQGVKDSVIVTDLEGRITFWNEGASSIYGYLQEEMIGRKLEELYPDRNREKFRADMRDILRGNDRIEEWEGADKGGQAFWVDSRMSAMHDADGHVTGLIRVDKDITERKRLEEELRKVQKMEVIGTLAGGIAHDFNNVLGIIISNAELAFLESHDMARPHLEQIVQAALRGRDVVRQILTFARRDEQKQLSAKLAPLIQDTAKLLRASIPSSIEIKLNMKTDEDSIFAEPPQIQQVILNLCTNAAYAMKAKGGTLEITLQKASGNSGDLPELDIPNRDYLVISVSDTGMGMDETTRRRIFEPFFTTKLPGEGTGLGLSVVYGIVTAHGGAIRVFSEPGKGSTFKVFLPTAKAQPVLPRSEQDTKSQIPRGSERILFIDDEVGIVESIKNVLQSLGYKVTAVMDGIEALRLFSENPALFDLVITDQTMPKITGEVLAKDLLRQRNVPIILCTGYSDLISREKAKSMGIQEFMEKPFTIRDLAETIRRVLDEKRPGQTC